MNKLLRSLLATTAFLTLVPTAASARPEDCHEECFETTPCEVQCWMGRTMTCGEYGVCAGARAEPSAASASVSQDETRQPATSQVCGEEPQAELAASVES